VLVFLYASFLDLYFFFFQAEDGIRDFHVTGVQTCALPISTPARRRSGGARPPLFPQRRPKRPRRAGRPWRSPPAWCSPGALPARSEERRVGKEGRSSGAPGD